MKEEFKALRYYFVFAGLVFAFFLYSGFIGWKWFGSTTTEKRTEKSTSNSGYRYRYFHK
ncbi:MAG: hypothetical protein ACK48F_03155 [Chryseotalea sp.]